MKSQGPGSLVSQEPHDPRREVQRTRASGEGVSRHWRRVSRLTFLLLVSAVVSRRGGYR